MLCLDERSSLVGLLALRRSQVLVGEDICREEGSRSETAGLSPDVRSVAFLPHDPGASFP